MAEARTVRVNCYENVARLGGDLIKAR